MQLWRQLDLKITPSTLIKDSGKEGSLWLNLQHQRADGTARKGRSHNLYQDACLTDLRPPTDIQALLPEQLVLDICFHTSNPQSKNQRFGATASTQTLCNADHGDDAMLYENAEEVDIVDRHKDGRDQPYSSQTAASQQEDRFTRPTSDCHFIAAAVDAALRSAIARKPTLPQGGIRLHHDMRQAYLQEIAPSIAAPGYLAVSCTPCRTFRHLDL